MPYQRAPRKTKQTNKKNKAQWATAPSHDCSENQRLQQYMGSSVFVCLCLCDRERERERDTLGWIGKNLRLFSLGSHVRNLESFLMRPPLMFPDKHCFNCASILCLTRCHPYTHRIQTIRGILIHPHNRCHKIALAIKMFDYVSLFNMMKRHVYIDYHNTLRE